LGRKQSVESISSIASGRSSISGMSLKSPSLNGDRSYQRVRAPEYDPASLPPLPEKKVKEEDAPRLPLRPTVSSPNVSKVNGNGPPPLPGRPALPSRTSTVTEQLAARPMRSVLNMGFGNKAKEIKPPPLPSDRPHGATNGHTGGHATTPPRSSSGPAVIELTTATFDDEVLRSGHPVFVDFSASFCKCRLPFS
jgi:hypothetical protein